MVACGQLAGRQAEAEREGSNAAASGRVPTRR